MKVLITNGTTDYLRTIQQKHPEAQIRILENTNTSIAYYEGNNTDLFTEAREYQTVDAISDMKDTGFVVMNHIPVTDEGRPIFEDRFKSREGKVEQMPGFQALRILRPTDGNTYIVLTLWEDEKSFQDWVESPSFHDAHNQTDARKREKPSYSAGASYVSQFHLV